MCLLPGQITPAGNRINYVNLVIPDNQDEVFVAEGLCIDAGDERRVATRLGARLQNARVLEIVSARKDQHLVEGKPRLLNKLPKRHLCVVACNSVGNEGDGDRKLDAVNQRRNLQEVTECGRGVRLNNEVVVELHTVLHVAAEKADAALKVRRALRISGEIAILLLLCKLYDGVAFFVVDLAVARREAPDSADDAVNIAGEDARILCGFDIRKVNLGRGNQRRARRGEANHEPCGHPAVYGHLALNLVQEEDCAERNDALAHLDGVIGLAVLFVDDYLNGVGDLSQRGVRGVVADDRAARPVQHLWERRLEAHNLLELDDLLPRGLGPLVVALAVHAAAG